MQQSTDAQRKLEGAFSKKQASILAEVIADAYNDLVKTDDFNELKGIVKELAEAQKELAVAQMELTEAQKRTEVEIRTLVSGLKETKGELGGLSRSVSYGFENEVYRMLPDILKKNYGIEIKDRLVRVEVGGKEINILGMAQRNGQDVVIVGEVKLRLDERRKKRVKGDVFAELDEKVEAVQIEYGDKEVVKILVSHYATRGFVKKAEEKGVIVIQSFEL